MEIKYCPICIQITNHRIINKEIFFENGHKKEKIHYQCCKCNKNEFIEIITKEGNIFSCKYEKI